MQTTGTILSAHVLAHGRQAIRAYWQRGIAAGGQVDFIQPLTTYCSRALGYTAGTHGPTNAGGESGRTNSPRQKAGGKWMIAAHRNGGSRSAFESAVSANSGAEAFTK